MSDLTYRETVTEYTTDTAPAEGDHWLRHDEIFQDTMGELIVLLRDEWRAAIREQVESLQEKIRSLELKLCEAAGAISVLRTGRVLNPRGTFDDAATYEMMDVVALNGGSFLAIKDRPGPCPGEGWKLLCSKGSRGECGLPGRQGERGEKGERGQSGVPQPMIGAWRIDAATYSITPVLTDGTTLPKLDVRPLLQRFLDDLRR